MTNLDSIEARAEKATDKIAEIESRHKSSAPFHGKSSPELQYNKVREDRAILLSRLRALEGEIERMKRVVEAARSPDNHHRDCMTQYGGECDCPLKPVADALAALDGGT